MRSAIHGLMHATCSILFSMYSWNSWTGPVVWRGIRQRSEDVLSTNGPCWDATKDEYRPHCHKAPQVATDCHALALYVAKFFNLSSWLFRKQCRSQSDWGGHHGWMYHAGTFGTWKHRTAGRWSQHVGRDLTARFWKWQVEVIHS